MKFDDVQAKPALIQFLDGTQALLKIDQLIIAENHIIAAGWHSKKIDLKFEADGRIIESTITDNFVRKDVNVYLGDADALHGFALCAEYKEPVSLNLIIANSDRAPGYPLDVKKAARSAAIINESLFGKKIASFLASLQKTGNSPHIAKLPENSPIKCNIDHVLRWPDSQIGNPVLIFGSLALPDDFNIRCGMANGGCEFEQSLCFYQRPDFAITNDLFLSRKPCGHGFVVVLIDYPETCDEVSVFAEQSAGKWLAASKGITNFYSYRRFLTAIFEVPIITTELVNLYAKALLPLFAKLQNRRMQMCLSAWHETQSLGNVAANPSASIIVPLYGDIELLERQLAAFAQDDVFCRNAELIYIIDDPEIVDSFKIRMVELHQKFGVPVRWLCWNMNMGFAVACNVGATVARGAYLVFMNSDVFPRYPGWLQEMINYLATRPDAGLAGCRLLYEDGSIQHCGINLEFDATLKLWRCSHPHRHESNQIDVSNTSQKALAATGACIAISRKDFLAVGGWSCDYLLGGFEDIDLCFKLAKRGKKTVCLDKPELTHLEGATLKKLSSGWLERLQVFNAVVFKEKWNKWLQAQANLT